MYSLSINIFTFLTFSFQDYYHGFIAEQDIAELLKKTGDFIVRSCIVEGKEKSISEGRYTTVEICVNEEKADIQTYVIQCQKDMYFFTDKIRRKTVPLLIQHYKDNKLKLAANVSIL